MKKHIILVLALVLSSGPLFAQSSHMTDDQVMSFVVKEHERGTANSQIVTKLMQKGVDISQIRRVRNKYQKMSQQNELYSTTAAGNVIIGLFPSFMSMIAVYYILRALNLADGAMIRVALIIVFSAGSGAGFYVAKGFLDTISKSLDEAAIIDGATRWNVFTKITVPLSKPIIVYTILTSFMGPWVDFIFGKVICRADAQYYTVSIGLWKMLEKEYIDSWYTCFAAGAVVVSIPIAILFLMTQKFYVEGITGGAVKG